MPPAVNRRLLLALGLLLLVPLARAAEGRTPPVLQSGPHLFVDDFLIEQSSHLTRLVNSPKRDLAQPVLTGKEDQNWQPYVSVVRDPTTRRFRMWYDSPTPGKGSHLAYMESNDGVHWLRPHRVLDDPAQIIFGASVLDEGPGGKAPEYRYRFLWWTSGLWLAHSADGLRWQKDQPRPVLTGTSDISSLARDPIRNRYLAVFGMPSTNEDGYQGRTPNAPEGYRRCVGQSASLDGVKWEPPRRIIKPDGQDEGITEFYSIGGVVARGGLLIGLLKVLREDLPCDPDGPRQGIGYTVLAWTRDGENWQRDRQPFFHRNLTPGSWDHAMAWGDFQLLVGDELYLYYGGYARGHKVARETERQIGLLRMPRDRYVCRAAGNEEGTLRTPLVKLDGDTMTLNVDASKGVVLRVQVLGADGRALSGFALADCEPVSADAVAAPLRWKRPLSALRGQTVRLEFAVRAGQLFGFDLVR
ncbi:MAG: hypothetical protein RL514_4760 [Verrucomicrobiota bacterium]|jgi:hypothetical protein